MSEAHTSKERRTPLTKTLVFKLGSLVTKAVSNFVDIFIPTGGK